jgi:hypothetical protein
MNVKYWIRGVLFAMLATTVSGPALLGDEGMWLFNNPPLARLAEKYGFKPDAAWMEHVQKSSVRFNSGGSGSFVSADGLVMTNHHVASDALQKLGTKEHNYYRDGFYARTRDKESKCEAMELNVLDSIEDVTARVNDAVKEGLSSDESFKARRAAMNGIENDENKKTGLRCNVVTLYQGAPTICTDSSVTRMCAWCLRRNNRLPFTVATRTILNILVTTSTSPFSESTKTTSQRRSNTFCHGAKMVAPTGSLFLFPAIPVGPTVWQRWPNLITRVTLVFRS